MVLETAIILPTYCEAENIGRIICAVKNLDLDLMVLVVDDSSPDETQNIVKQLSQRYTNIVLLSRPRKLGLGTAITDGFRFLLSQEEKLKHIITMDADFSHSPSDIPRLLDAAMDGSDLVVGSRYCRGGKASGWSMTRRLISRTANKLASKLVKLPINDFTSGFRCYSTKYVESVLPKIHSQTYEVQIETIRQAKLLNFCVREVPITFENRKKGKSKLSPNEVLAFSRYIHRVYWQ